MFARRFRHPFPGGAIVFLLRTAMNASTRRGRLIRFSVFEVDLDSHELFKQGRKVKLQGQPFEVLVALLSRQGEVVSRDELQQKIWPSESVGDFDQGLNRAINKVREALGDSAASPQFVETLPRLGYRFVGLIQEESDVEPAAGRPQTTSTLILPPNQKRGWASKSRLAVGAVAVLALLIAGYFYIHHPSKLTDRDTIVLADFTNTTGDRVFDDTLRQGLTVQLGQSPFLSLISDERIHHVLPLMGQPPDARLTPELAREICERTMSAAVLDGSIANLGSQYVLGLRALNCRTGETIDEEQVQAARKEDVLNALSHIASRFRGQAGESLKTLEKYDAPLQEATTPSLEALKAYSAGWKVLFSSGSTAALPFFKHAIEVDPKFAIAYAALGRAYGDIGESTLSAENTAKAYELRDRAGDEEKYFITASYHKQVEGDLEKAEQTCELWMQAYPRALAPHGFLTGAISLNRGHFERSLREADLAIRLDPDAAIIYSNLALSDVALNRLNEAQAVLRRASERKLDIPDFAIQRYVIAFLRGDTAEMKREAAQAHEGTGAEDWMSNAEGFALAYFGHLGEAKKMSRRAADLARASNRRETEALYETDSALREALFGNASMARQSATAALQLSNSRDVEYGVAFALALAGESSQPQTLMADILKRFPKDTKVRFNYEPTLRALLALNHHEPAKAIEFLQTAAPYEIGIVSSGGSEILLGAGSFYPAYVRGRAYLDAGQGEKAVAEFTKILDHPGIVVSDPIGALGKLQLGRAYVLAGDKEKAGTGYKDFLTLWKDADPGIPIFEEAKAEYAKLR